MLHTVRAITDEATLFFIAAVKAVSNVHPVLRGAESLRPLTYDEIFTLNTL
jgi:hypothetical protein